MTSMTEIRSLIARNATHPGAITARLRGDTLFLTGPILVSDQDRLIRSLRALPGIARLENQLRPVPSVRKGQHGFLSGPSNRIEYRSEFIESDWAPSIRVIAGLVSAILEYRAVRNSGRTRGLFFFSGIGLMARAIANVPLTQLIGTMINPVVRLMRTLEVAAPIDDVFEFWKDFSNFPRFMSYIQDVEVNDRGGLRWTLVGPGGLKIEWDAEVTALITNQRVEWRSLPRSPIGNSGNILMEEVSSGLTRIRVELSYAPPAGALGYAIAHFFGYDPRSKIDEDLAVMKILIESQSTLERGVGSFASFRST